MKLTNSSIRFQSEVLEGFLRKIYDGFNINEEIEPSLWREFLRHFNEASAEGIIESEHLTHEERFLSNLKHSNEVFSAFKSHSMGVRMQERLRDEEGKLRSFKDWARAVAPIAQHHVGAWLKTEYDTAILRAHQASDWQEFERNRDILPNLRWMPTTSPSPENIHEGFWSMRLTLPVGDPFWEEHHPANRWNCKCSLEATSDSPQAPMSEQPSTAQRGLDENPRHGRTFSDKHPYFPKSCKACPYYKPKKGLANQLKELWNKREKDCYNCPHVNAVLDRAKIAEGEVYTPDKKYGKRLLTSVKADKTDLEDNKRVSKALLESFPEMKIKIRPHIREIKDIKNPELEINGLKADNKKIKSEQGVTSGFKKALEQGCQSVVIDLDANLKRLNIKKLSQYIDWRKEDFNSQRIKECYVVFEGKAILIDKAMSRTEIKKTLKQLQP